MNDEPARGPGRHPARRVQSVRAASVNPTSFVFSRELVPFISRLPVPLQCLTRLDVLSGRARVYNVVFLHSIALTGFRTYLFPLCVYPAPVVPE